MTERCVTTSGTATGPGVPDAVSVVLAIEVTAGTPAEALTACGEVQERVIRALGVSASAGGLSVQPLWDHERNRPGRPQATSRVTAQLPDIALAGTVVTAALEVGGTAVRLESLSPFVSDTDAALATAREGAFAAARVAAEQYAALAGLRLGTVSSVQQAGAQVFHGVAAMAARRSGYEVPQGTQDVSASVTVTWELAD